MSERIITYSTADVAAALGISQRVLDNLLARYCRDIVPAGRQGSSRSIDGPVVERLAVTLLLRRDLRVPFEFGWPLAGRVLSDNGQRTAFGTLGAIIFDVPRLRSVVRQALADSTAERNLVRRGRPRAKKKWGAPL